MIDKNNPAEQASKQVPTIDTPELRDLIGDVYRAGSYNESIEKSEDALMAHIEATLAVQPAAPVAGQAGLATWQGAADWLRNNAYLYPNLATICDAMVAASPEAAPVAATEQAKDTPESMASSNTRFAIDGAIQYGRENRNQPPSKDHWLYEYWNIGRQLNEAGRTGWDNVTPLATPADAGAGLTDEVAQQVHHALELAMAICDAVPTRAHAISEDDPLRHIGRMVNYHESTGAHGYAVIRDAKEAFERELAHLSTPAARPNADCSGDPSNCPDNEGHGCECGYGAPAAPVTAEPVAHLYEWIGDDESVRRKGDIIARSVEELNGNIDMHQHCWKRIGALSAAPVSPQPAAQVPSIERDQLEEAAKIADSVGHHWSGAPALAFFEIAEKIRALKGQPAAAHAAKSDEDGELLRLVVENRMDLHFEGQRDTEDDAVWVDELMKWSDGDRLGATRALVREAAAAHAAHDQKGGGNE